MKHLDFERVIILDIEGARIDVIRMHPQHQAESRCECCGEQAEYELRSDWDPLGQCMVYECQSCLSSGMGAPDSPDTYIFVAA